MPSSAAGVDREPGPTRARRGSSTTRAGPCRSGRSGSARSRIDRGGSPAGTSFRFTRRTRPRAATPVQEPSRNPRPGGNPRARGERYGSTRPRLTSRNGRTGSPDQNTSACGRLASAMSRFRTPVLFVSSVSKTALIAMPDSFSKARKAAGAAWGDLVDEEQPARLGRGRHRSRIEQLIQRGEAIQSTHRQSGWSAPSTLGSAPAGADERGP